MGKRVVFFQIGVGVDFLVLLPTVVTQCQLKGVLLWCVFSRDRCVEQDPYFTRVCGTLSSKIRGLRPT